MDAHQEIVTQTWAMGTLLLSWSIRALEFHLLLEFILPYRFHYYEALKPSCVQY